MKLDPREVRRVADLAHLELDASREESLCRDLVRILGHIETMGELDGAMAGAPEPAEAGSSPLREDAPAASLERDEALANAPESGSGCFKVPRVLPP